MPQKKQGWWCGGEEWAVGSVNHVGQVVENYYYSKRGTIVLLYFLHRSIDQLSWVISGVGFLSLDYL